MIERGAVTLKERLSDLIGRDIQTTEYNTYRRPIKQISLQEVSDNLTVVIIHTAWIARMTENGWKMHREPEEGGESVTLLQINPNYFSLTPCKDGTYNIWIQHLCDGKILAEGVSLKREEIAT